MNNDRVYIVIMLLLIAAVARGQSTMAADGVRLVRSGGSVQLSLDVVLDGTPLPRRSMVVLTPRLVGATDSVDFPPIAVFGRDAYYRDVRHGTVTASIPDSAYRIRYKGAPRREHYARTIGWQPWMSSSTLRLVANQGTPCDLGLVSVADTTAFSAAPPDTILVWPTITAPVTATESVSGEARIQFIVNRTEFEPTLANNRRELDKVRTSIDSVRHTPAVSNTRYTIKGYASPEGPYSNNVRLAKGRTERLKEYITGNWGVPSSQVTTDSQPEDWQGMRRYVADHRAELPDADAVLDIIDHTAPDADLDSQLAVIQQHYPQTYSRLLRDCFPVLRHTEYTISYDRTYSIEEQRRATRPDTILRPAALPQGTVPLADDIQTLMAPSRPWLAVKTNLLFDLLLAPNIELELPIGDRWSLMAEYWCPWWLHNDGKSLSIGRYIAPGSDMKTDAFKVQAYGAEARWWLSSRRCPEARPRLTGAFVGLYYAHGKYDLERDREGDQGEFDSVGLTYGYSWPLARHWNLEASISAGYFWGPRRHYESQFGDTHLIWQYTGHTNYFGPTKLKLSLVWLIPSLRKQKGGAHE